MLSLLSNPSFFTGIFVAVIIVSLIYLMIKYPSFRIACFFILVIVYVFITLYCVINLNIYYNASGGIFGEVTGLFSPTVTVEESVFNFDNLELVQYLDTDTYYCKITSDKVVTVDDEKDYMVYVNEKPCSNVVVNKDLLSADYHYLFFDENNDLLCDDTLIIRFSFGINESYCYVETKNGSESVQFWNYYFNRNNFIVSFKENSYLSDSEIKYGTGDVPQLYKVDYVYTDNQVETKYYTENSKLELTNIVGIENWTIENVVVDETYVIQSDLTVKANFYETNQLLEIYQPIEMLNGNLIVSNAEEKGIIYVDNETQSITVISDYGYGWNEYSLCQNGFIHLKSKYSTVEPRVFVEWTKEIYKLDFDYDYYYFYGNSVMCKLIYSVKNQEGFYLYDFLTNETTQLHSEETWTSFVGKYNENTGSYSTVKIKGQNEDYYYTYDFVKDSLVQHDSDKIVGF